MPSLSRILVPVEFSPRCRGAVQYAEALSCHFHCEIVLLHVVMPPLANYTSFEAMAYSSAADLAREIAELRTADESRLANRSVSRQMPGPMADSTRCRDRCDRLLALWVSLKPPL